MNEYYTPCLPLYEVTVHNRRKKGYENINKNTVRWCAEEIGCHMKEKNYACNAVFSEHNVKALHEIRKRRLTGLITSYVETAY